MLNAVIVDDEIPVLQLLKMFLEKIEGINIIDIFKDPNEALKNIVNLKPDVVFLDIEMPEINGIELANFLIEQDNDLMIVFVTGYNQYAVEAFEVNALDYILKPVTPSRLEKCISRLLKRKSQKIYKENNEIERKIFCLGNFEVYGSKGVIKFPTRKVEEMLAYFVFHKDSNVDGTELGEILWPESDPEKIKANFDTSLFRLRKTIKENELPIDICSKRGGKGIYRCTLNEVSSDLIEFESIGLKDTEVNESNIEIFEKACLLYRNDLFSTKNYEWCESEREYLLRLYIKILKNIASFYEMQKLYDKALDKLLIAQEKSPFDEEIHINILKIYNKQKNRALLVKSHDEFKMKLINEIGIEPDKETNQAFIKMLNGI